MKVEMVYAKELRALGQNIEVDFHQFLRIALNKNPSIKVWY